MDKTEEYLNSLKWQDISIIVTPNNDSILILLCPNHEESDKLYHLITNNEFTLTVIEKPSGTHELHLSLDRTEYIVNFITPKTVENYPPLKFLRNKQVNSITAGFYDEKRQLRYNMNLHPLNNNQIKLN